MKASKKSPQLTSSVEFFSALQERCLNATENSDRKGQIKNSKINNHDKKQGRNSLVKGSKPQADDTDVCELFLDLTQHPERLQLEE